VLVERSMYVVKNLVHIHQLFNCYFCLYFIPEGVHNKIQCGNYFVFSLIRVDKEGLNILSLNVSNKAFGADKDGDNLNKILASLQYEGDI
jgi:hypothetical protein